MRSSLTRRVANNSSNPIVSQGLAPPRQRESDQAENHQERRRWLGYEDEWRGVKAGSELRGRVNERAVEVRVCRVRHVREVSGQQARTCKLRVANIRLIKNHAVEDRIHEVGVSSVNIGQEGAGQIGAAEARIRQSRITQVHGNKSRAHKVRVRPRHVNERRAGQVGSSEPCIGDVRIIENRGCDRGICEIGVPQVCRIESRIVQVAVREIGVLKIGRLKIGIRENDALEVVVSVFRFERMIFAGVIAERGEGPCGSGCRAE